MESIPIVTQCPSCFKLLDIDGEFKKLKSVNFLLPFQYHGKCPECKKKETTHVDSRILHRERVTA